MKYLLMLLMLVFSFSCNPLKHYQKVALDTEVTPKKKAVIAPWVATHFAAAPPIYIKGKDSIRVDTAYDNSKIDSLSAKLDSLLGGTDINIDSLKAAIIKDCKPKIITVTKQRVDTIEKESSAQAAKIFTINRDLDVANSDNVTKELKIKELENALRDSQKSKGNLWIFLIISIVLNLALLYLLFKPKISLR